MDRRLGHHETKAFNRPVRRKQFLHRFRRRAHLDNNFWIVDGFGQTTHLVATPGEYIARLVAR